MNAHERALADWLDGDGDAATTALLVATADTTAPNRLIELARFERELAAVLAPVDLQARVHAAIADDSGRYAVRVMGEVRRHATRPSPRRGPTRRGPMWWPLGVGGLAAAAMVFVLLRSSLPAPVTTSPAIATTPIAAVPHAELGIATGPLRAVRRGANRDLVVGDQVLAADELHAASASGVCLNDETILTIAADTVLILDADAAGRRIDLRQGEFAAAITPQPPGQPLRLITPRLRAVVVGTELDLCSTATGDRLGVRSGRVQVQDHDGASAALGAGQWALSRSGVALVTGEGGAWSLGHAWVETVTLGEVLRDAGGRACGTRSVAADPQQNNRWFAPDQTICIQSDQKGPGGPPYLARLPAGFRLTLRMRAERAGRIAVTMAPPRHQTGVSDAGALELPIGSAWSQIVLTADRFTGSGAPAPVVDYPLWTLCVFGFGAGRLELTAVTIDPPLTP
jgi:FecR protein